jgi:hypothetical protein
LKEHIVEPRNSSLNKDFRTDGSSKSKEKGRNFTYMQTYGLKGLTTFKFDPSGNFRNIIFR